MCTRQLVRLQRKSGMDDFAQYLAEIRSKLSAVAEVSAEKDIAYGHQFTVLKDDEKVILTVYNGKKGRRLVWGGSAGNLAAALQAAVNSGKTETAGMLQQKQFTGIWAGSDESGKGDFFGPLVVAAVAVDNAAAARLNAAGVKDCKLLTDKKILELETAIKEIALSYSVLELKPEIYNLRYEQVRQEGGNLNRLLGYGHIAALSQVLREQPKCSGALIDQFTASDAVIRALTAKFFGVDFRQQPRAESNIAVAAASILARAQFLHRMEALSEQAGFILPKGGGTAATEAARQLLRQLGQDALRGYVKLHFANYAKLK